MISSLNAAVSPPRARATALCSSKVLRSRAPVVAWPGGPECTLGRLGRPERQVAQSGVHLTIAVPAAILGFIVCAEVAELADAHDSKSCGQPPCGFDSHLRHQPALLPGAPWGAGRPGRSAAVCAEACNCAPFRRQMRPSRHYNQGWSTAETDCPRRLRPRRPARRNGRPTTQSCTQS